MDSQVESRQASSNVHLWTENVVFHHQNAPFSVGFWLPEGHLLVLLPVFRAAPHTVGILCRPTVVQGCVPTTGGHGDTFHLKAQTTLRRCIIVHHRSKVTTYLALPTWFLKAM